MDRIFDLIELGEKKLRGTHLRYIQNFFIILMLPFAALVTWPYFVSMAIIGKLEERKLNKLEGIEDVKR